MCFAANSLPDIADEEEREIDELTRGRAGSPSIMGMLNINDSVLDVD